MPNIISSVGYVAEFDGEKRSIGPVTRRHGDLDLGTVMGLPRFLSSIDRWVFPWK